jgi:hypothetical protein
MICDLFQPSSFIPPIAFLLEFAFEAMTGAKRELFFYLTIVRSAFFLKLSRRSQ